MVLFIMLYEQNLTFKSMNEMLKCGSSCSFLCNIHRTLSFYHELYFIQDVHFSNYNLFGFFTFSFCFFSEYAPMRCGISFPWNLPVIEMPGRLFYCFS